jgi:thioredoxin-dependent peroxiredoxin
LLARRQAAAECRKIPPEPIGRIFHGALRRRGNSSYFSAEYGGLPLGYSPSIADHPTLCNIAKSFPHILISSHTREGFMALQINDTAPDFEAETTEGKIRFYDWAGSNWVVLFSHPKDFTPVCTTELGTMAKLKPEFDKRGVKIIGLSVDPVENHKKWSGDIKDVVGFEPNYPMIGDTDLKVSKLYGMLPASTAGTSEGRTPNDNATVRNVFIIGPDRKIKLVLVYPMSTGRNFDEVLRVIDSLQLTAKHRVATPANWKQGEDVILTAAVTNDEAQKLYPQGWKSLKPYIRVVPQPRQ